MNGAKLRQLLDERGVSVLELSKRSGVTNQAIYRILNGDTKTAYAETMLKIADALGVRLEELR